MASFDDVRRLGSELPEVAESTFYGTPALKAQGKAFCRMWSQREHDRDGVHDTEVLVVFCELEAKDALLEAHVDVLFSTPHYEGHGAMLIRLAAVDLDDLADWLEDSYRLRAPAALVGRLDEPSEAPG
jgi:hypothetical protein